MKISVTEKCNWMNTNTKLKFFGLNCHEVKHTWPSIEERLNNYMQLEIFYYDLQRN